MRLITITKDVRGYIIDISEEGWFMNKPIAQFLETTRTDMAILVILLAERQTPVKVVYKC